MLKISGLLLSNQRNDYCSVKKNNFNSPLLKKYDSQDSVSFSKHRKYSSKHLRLFKQIKSAALKYELPDIFTGKTFTQENPPTIEHLVSFLKLKELGLKDGRWNWVLTTKETNLARIDKEKGDLSIPELFAKNPEYKENFFKNTQKYEKAKIHGFGVKQWINSVRNTVECLLNGVTPKDAEKLKPSELDSLK